MPTDELEGLPVIDSDERITVAVRLDDLQDGRMPTELPPRPQSLFKLLSMLVRLKLAQWLSRPATRGDGRN